MQELECTVDANGEKLTAQVYNRLLTETEVTVAWPDADEGTPLAKRQRLWSGSNWCALARMDPQQRGSFEFRVAACQQLRIEDCSFPLLVERVADPKHPTKGPVYGVQPLIVGEKDSKAFTRDVESVADVWLTASISITPANIDERFDRPFFQMLDDNKCAPCLVWRGPTFKQLGGTDIVDKHMARVSDPHMLGEEWDQPKHFLEQAYSGEFVFYCSAAFSRPASSNYRLAVRVKATVPSQGQLGNFMIEGFLLPNNWFFKNAVADLPVNLDAGNRRLGLVWDLDETLVSYLGKRSDDWQNESAYQKAARDNRLHYLGENDRRVEPEKRQWFAVRVGVQDMLQVLHGVFVMHVYCNGHLSYALQVVAAAGWGSFFGRHRVTSGAWTTKRSVMRPQAKRPIVDSLIAHAQSLNLQGYGANEQRVACHGSGCKDFREIFGFYRYAKYREMVLAVDNNERVWNDSLAMWERLEEKPCLLKIPDFEVMTSTGVTSSHFQQLIQMIRRLYLNAAEVSRADGGPISRNVELQPVQMAENRSEPGYMISLRDRAERELRKRGRGGGHAAGVGRAPSGGGSRDGNSRPEEGSNDAGRRGDAKGKSDGSGNSKSGAPAPAPASSVSHQPSAASSTLPPVLPLQLEPLSPDSQRIAAPHSPLVTPMGETSALDEPP